MFGEMLRMLTVADLAHDESTAGRARAAPAATAQHVRAVAASMNGMFADSPVMAADTSRGLAALLSGNSPPSSGMPWWSSKAASIEMRHVEISEQPKKKMPSAWSAHRRCESVCDELSRDVQGRCACVLRGGGSRRGGVQRCKKEPSSDPSATRMQTTWCAINSGPS